MKILVLDDDPAILAVVASFLKKEFEVFVSSLPFQALEILSNESIDILISDIRMPEMDGLTLVKKVKKDYPEIEIIMISSHGDMNTVIEAMHLGAFDFFNKPFDVKDIKLSIERTKKFRQTKQELKRIKLTKSVLTDEIKQKEGSDLVSSSDAMKEIKDVISRVAQTDDTSVLITGESGTGKELVARGIHNLSSRAGEFFGAVNTSAIPESLFESEFFGHKKGSFTGAIGDKAGWFEVADKGTLFLDEIGDMPQNLQIKLLRVLEDRRFNKVGTAKQQEFNIRIIAATNKRIDELQNGDSFRSDLYYRISTFEIHIPPLRERKEDIAVLLEHFLHHFATRMRKKITGVDHEAVELLSNYQFPGNVRELRNLCERAVILSDGGFINCEHFPQISQNTLDMEVRNNIDQFNLEFIERETIKKVLEMVSYNKSEAAKLLNLQWNALYRRIQKYSIEVPS